MRITTWRACVYSCALASLCSVCNSFPGPLPKHSRAKPLLAGRPNRPRGTKPVGGRPAGPLNENPSLVQRILDKSFEAGFSLLYLGDSSGMIDSFKNLRVLWTRALLHSLGEINDPIAIELLPKKTQWVVGKRFSSFWKLTPAVGKLDWIVNRTNFIDKEVDSFLTETTRNRQIVLIGSGYDTRALRYQSRDPNVMFFEVDLPEVTKRKIALMENLAGLGSGNTRITHIPFDLNSLQSSDKSILSILEAQAFSSTAPTLVVFEAVLFYLAPEAAKRLVDDVFSLKQGRFCFTDNLSAFGVAPGPPVPTPKEKCESWLRNSDKRLVNHNAIWGGAIHFVGAQSRNP